jgi:hypothetical protein
MAVWIGEASLLVNSPRSVMIGERLHVSGSGCRCTFDQCTGVIYEHLDPSRRHPDLVRARLARSPRDSLVQEEWRSPEMQTCDPAKVPHEIGAQRALVPLNRRRGVRDDQHHRER